MKVWTKLESNQRPGLYEKPAAATELFVRNKVKAAGENRTPVPRLAVSCLAIRRQPHRCGTFVRPVHRALPELRVEFRQEAVRSPSATLGRPAPGGTDRHRSHQHRTQRGRPMSLLTDNDCQQAVMTRFYCQRPRAPHRLASNELTPHPDHPGPMTQTRSVSSGPEDRCDPETKKPPRIAPGRLYRSGEPNCRGTLPDTSLHGTPKQDAPILHGHTRQFTSAIEDGLMCHGARYLEGRFGAVNMYLSRNRIFLE